MVIVSLKAIDRVRRVSLVIELPEDVHETKTGVQSARHCDREERGEKTSLVVIGEISWPPQLSILQSSSSAMPFNEVKASVKALSTASGNNPEKYVMVVEASATTSRRSTLLRASLRVWTSGNFFWINHSTKRTVWTKFW